MKKEESIKPKNKRLFQKPVGGAVFITLMLVWPTVHFLVFWVYIYTNTVWLSFQTMTSTGYEFFGVRNFTNFFRELGRGDSSLYYGVINSLKLFVFNFFVTIPLSVFVAFCFYKKMPGSKILRIIYFLPNVISVVIMTMVFSWSFDLKIGFMSKILGSLGLKAPEMGYFGANNSFNMVLFYSLWVGIGYFAMLLAGSMSRIPPEILESGKLDGMGFFTEFFRIVLPLVSPMITTLTIMSMGSVFTYFLPVMLLTNGGPNGHSYTIALQMTLSATTDAPSSATVGVVCSAIGVPLIMGVRKLLGKLFPETEY